MYDFNQQESILDSNLLPSNYGDFLTQMRAKQNLTRGAIAGFLGAIAGGILWATITYATNYQIGYMALAIGYLVGYLMRIFGKGIDPVFSYVGAALALFGCVFGNVLTMIFLLSKEGYCTLDFISVLKLLFNFDFISLALTNGFQLMDLFFYAIAMYEGYRFSRIDV